MPTLFGTGMSPSISPKSGLRNYEKDSSLWSSWFPGAQGESEGIVEKWNSVLAACGTPEAERNQPIEFTASHQCCAPVDVDAWSFNICAMAQHEIHPRDEICEQDEANAIRSSTRGYLDFKSRHIPPKSKPKVEIVQTHPAVQEEGCPSSLAPHTRTAICQLDEMQIRLQQNKKALALLELEVFQMVLAEQAKALASLQSTSDSTSSEKTTCSL